MTGRRPVVMSGAKDLDQHAISEHRPAGNDPQLERGREKLDVRPRLRGWRAEALRHVGLALFKM